MTAKPKTTCANCGRLGDFKWYAHDTAFGTTLSRFCKDCWVIVYGEGQYVKHE